MKDNYHKGNLENKISMVLFWIYLAYLIKIEISVGTAPDKGIQLQSKQQQP